MTGYKFADRAEGVRRLGENLFNGDMEFEVMSIQNPLFPVFPKNRDDNYPVIEPTSFPEPVATLSEFGDLELVPKVPSSIQPYKDALKIKMEYL